MGRRAHAQGAPPAAQPDNQGVKPHSGSVTKSGNDAVSEQAPGSSHASVPTQRSKPHPHATAGGLLVAALAALAATYCRSRGSGGEACLPGLDNVMAPAANTTPSPPPPPLPAPALGVFPRGCKWRAAAAGAEPGGALLDDAAVQCEWWDELTGNWTDRFPATDCTPPGFAPHALPPGWHGFHNGTPRSEVACNVGACEVRNLYHNNGRWYVLVDGGGHVAPIRMSRNQEAGALHVRDAARFIASLPWRLIPGDTVFFDYVFYTHPTAIGHWWEMIGPMYSALRIDPTAIRNRPPDQVVLLHLKRCHLFEWVRALLAEGLGVPPSEALPPIFMQAPVGDIHLQLSSPIEGLDPGTWYIFERVVIARDLYTGGTRKFWSTDDARAFRAGLYARHGLPPPVPAPATDRPKLITFQRKRANRRVVNEAELLALLASYGAVEVVEYSSRSTLEEQLAQMARTDVFVAVHTSNLANAPLLRPGAVVVELLQRHWHAGGLDTSFNDQTGCMGDIHHFAWRALFRNQTVYLNPRDEAKVAHWLASECTSRECVEAHTRVHLVVDIKELKALLDERLGCVGRGGSVEECKAPWPQVHDVPEDAFIREG